MKDGTDIKDVPRDVLEAEYWRLKQENLHLRDEAGFAAGDDHTMGTVYHMTEELEVLRKLRWVIGMLLAKSGRDALRRRYGLDIPAMVFVRRGVAPHLSDEDWEYAQKLASRMVVRR
jgi:hypothetical protein